MQATKWGDFNNLAVDLKLGSKQKWSSWAWKTEFWPLGNEGHIGERMQQEICTEIDI